MSDDIKEKDIFDVIDEAYAACEPEINLLPDCMIPDGSNGACQAYFQLRSALDESENKLKKYTEASSNKTDWCPVCKQGWECAKTDQASRVRVAELEAKNAELESDARIMADDLTVAHTLVNGPNNTLIFRHCACPACIIAAKYREG